MTLFDGIRSRLVETPGLNVNILERDGDDPSTPPERTVVFIHGNVSSALFWQEVMQDLPSDLRVLAIDLRGFGGTEHAPVDATRGVRDFSDDVWATLEALGIPTGLSPDKAAEALRKHRFAFLHAPTMHPAMKAVLPVRRALGIRMIGNGDVRARSIKRVASAVGEGSMAITLVHQYLVDA